MLPRSQKSSDHDARLSGLAEDNLKEDHESASDKTSLSGDVMQAALANSFHKACVFGAADPDYENAFMGHIARRAGVNTGVALPPIHGENFYDCSPTLGNILRLTVMF